VALTDTAVLGAIQGLLAQKPLGGADATGYRPRPGALILLVPNELWATAQALAVQSGSAIRGLFGERGEYVVPSGLLTDPNNWGVHWSSAIAPSVSVLSFAGREEPSLLGPTDEWEPQGMQRDELTFKIEHHWQPVINDFRFAVKSTVA
jgi:hypothetical protein